MLSSVLCNSVKFDAYPVCVCVCLCACVCGKFLTALLDLMLNLWSIACIYMFFEVPETPKKREAFPEIISKKEEIVPKDVPPPKTVVTPGKGT